MAKYWNLNLNKFNYFFEANSQMYQNQNAAGAVCDGNSFGYGNNFFK
jgi:hypothetical protein